MKIPNPFIPILSPSYLLDSFYYFKKEEPYRKEDFSISAIIPARNEEKNLRDCLTSLTQQLYELDEIVVVDDASIDKTSEIAKEFGVKVIRNKTSQGKTKSLIEGLKYINSELVLFVDADTILEKNFTDEIRIPFSNENVAGACGTVFSKKFENFTEKARLAEYIFYQYFRKIAQNKRKALYTVAGCCVAFRKDLLEKYGIPRRTEVEDMDLTWSLQGLGYEIIYWPKAIAYTQEPQTIGELIKQLRRWYCGMWQTLFLHGKKHFQKNKRLVSTTWLQIGENIPFSFIYLSLPALIYFYPLWGIGFLLVDAFSLLIPLFYHSKNLKVLRKTMKSLPYYYLLRSLNCLASIYGFFKTSYQYISGKREWYH